MMPALGLLPAIPICDYCRRASHFAFLAVFLRLKPFGISRSVWGWLPKQIQKVVCFLTKTFNSLSLGWLPKQIHLRCGRQLLEFIAILLPPSGLPHVAFRRQF